MAIAIAVFLAGVGVVLLWLGYRLWRSLMQSAGRLAQPLEMREILTPSRPPRADALVYLYGHKFARPPKPGRSGGRLAALDPLTNQELDPREWTAKMLFALFAEECEAGAIQFRVVEHLPTLTPPFPHKNWEMEARRVEPLLSSPLGDCLSVAFDMVEKHAASRKTPYSPPLAGESGALSPAKGAERGSVSSEQHLHDAEATNESQWFPLDLLIEKMLQVVRAETSFWEREGVYGDLRNYVIDALIAEGYLLERGGDTLIDHFRRRRIEPKRDAVESVAPATDSLLRRLHTVRQRFGSEAFLAAEERDITYSHLNAPASLTTREDPDMELLWADALGITLYETLISLRQLEPSGEGGL